MTDEVAALVLRNNYLQTLALSLAERRGLEDLGFAAAADADAGNARRARPRGRVPARRHGARRAPAALAGADPAGARGAARLCQALAQRRARCSSSVPDDPYLGARARPLFPARDRGALPRRARASPAAARDHRHPARQLDDQPRRAVADRAHRRPDRRRARPHRGRLRGRARQLRHDRAQRRDRRARQQGARQAAARALCGGAGSAARPAGLVPAQRRSRRRASPRSSRITAPASRRSRPRSTTRCRRRRPPRARRARPS